MQGREKIKARFKFEIDETKWNYVEDKGLPEYVQGGLIIEY